MVPTDFFRNAKKPGVFFLLRRQPLTHALVTRAANVIITIRTAASHARHHDVRAFLGKRLGKKCAKWLAEGGDTDGKCVIM